MRDFFKILVTLSILSILFIVGLVFVFYIALTVAVVLLVLYLAMGLLRFKTEARAREGDLEVILLTEGVSYTDVTPPENSPAKAKT
mgnify:CR=1 FL=1